MDNSDQNQEQQGQKRRQNGVDLVNKSAKAIINKISPLPIPGLGGKGKKKSPEEQAVEEGAKLALRAINSFPVTRAVTIGIIIVIAILILMVFFFSGGGGSSLLQGGGGGGGNEQGASGGGAPQFPPIPGLTLTLTGPTAVNNGQLISYSVGITYDPNVATVPLEEITVFNSLPQNTSFSSATGIFTNSGGLVSWPLSELSNQSGFAFTLSPTADNIFLDVEVYAQASPPAGGGTGGVCSEGSGPCSVQNLTSYFGDAATARQASIICNRESGSNPGALNDGCLDGSSVDYSIGLFQINMLAHCPGAFSSYSFDPPSCTIGNQSALDQCYARFSDPVQNINYAKQLYSSSGWGPWSASNACGIN